MYVSCCQLGENSFQLTIQKRVSIQPRNLIVCLSLFFSGIYDGDGLFRRRTKAWIALDGLCEDRWGANQSYSTETVNASRFFVLCSSSAIDLARERRRLMNKLQEAETFETQKVIGTIRRVKEARLGSLSSATSRIEHHLFEFIVVLPPRISRQLCIVRVEFSERKINEVVTLTHCLFPTETAALRVISARACEKNRSLVQRVSASSWWSAPLRNWFSKRHNKASKAPNSKCDCDKNQIR